MGSVRREGHSGVMTTNTLIRPSDDRWIAGVCSGLGRRFGIWTAAGFLPIQIGTGIALASHKGVTFASLGDPGYGRTLATKLAVFAVVMALAAVHGVARSRGSAQLARGCAVASLLGSVWIIVLATALPTT